MKTHFLSTVLASLALWCAASGRVDACSNVPPVASLTASPNPACVGSAVTFDGSGSHDTDGTITNYAWDWTNDGTYDQSGSASSASHTYTTAGTYTAKLKVTDDDGATGTTTVTVTVVKVDKVQYYDPDSSAYVDVTQTLYVMQGTNVTFKAIRYPSGGSWPSGKPVWGGTSGASGTGETKSVTFNSVSSSASDYKTVTATCGNTVTANVIVYELTGYHVAVDNFSGRATTTYGVAEPAYLDFTVSPDITATQMGGLHWSPQAGNGELTDEGYGLGTYECYYWNCDYVTLRLTVQSGPSKNKYVDMEFAVINPISATFCQAYGSGIWHVVNTASVGFKGTIYLQPPSVSFHYIKFGEGSCPATLSGWFSDKCPNGYPHPQNGPFNVDSGNSGLGSRVTSDDEVYGSCPEPPAFADGYLIWEIPWRYTVTGDSWVQFDDPASQRFDIDATGKLTIQKKGVGPFSKEFADPSSDW